MDWKQAAKSSVKVLWKPIAAAEAAWWATSGANLFHQVHDVSSARQFIVSGAVALGVGALTAVEKYGPKLVLGLWSKRTIDTGPGSTEPPVAPEPVPVEAAE